MNPTLLLLIALTCGDAPRPAAPPPADGFSQCLDAVCRIRAGNSLGTGCSFMTDATHVYVLTNAHVAGRRAGGEVVVEFWKRGYKSRTVRGRTAWASWQAGRYRDVAVVAVEGSQFGGSWPRTVPLAPRGTPVAAGDTVTTIGCPHATWPTLWRGHLLAAPEGAQGAVLHLTPSVEAGRSGSAVFDERGRWIVGLVAWNSGSEGPDGYGIAMSLEELYAALEGRPATAQRPPAARGLAPAAAPPPGDGSRRVPVVRPLSVQSCIHGVPFARDCLQCPQGPWRPIAPRLPDPPDWNEPWPGLPQSPLGGGEPAAPPDDPRFDTLSGRIDQLTGRVDSVESMGESWSDWQSSVDSRFDRTVGEDRARSLAREIALGVLAERLPGLGTWVAGALGLSGPPATALLVGLWLAGRLLARRLGKEPACQSGRRRYGFRGLRLRRQSEPIEDLPPSATPAGPRPARRREFVPYEKPNGQLSALEWAMDELVRRNPGARETVETIEAFARQHAAAHHG